MSPPKALGRISPEWSEQESRNITHLPWTISLTNLPDMTSIAASGRLQNAVKYCTKVRKTGVAGNSWIIRPLFNVESPNFTRSSMPTYSSATPDMTSPTTSGRHLSKFKKPAEIAASNGFGLNYSHVTFAWNNKLVGFLYRTTEENVFWFRINTLTEYFNLGFSNDSARFYD